MIKKRDGKRYSAWREAVYERDKHTCQHCGATDRKLHPHHIVRWEDDVNLRIDVDNGITLCTSCHNKEHHIGRVAWNKGQKMSLEQRKKLSEAKLGKPSPKKGKKTGKPAWNRGTKGLSKGMPKGTKFTEEHRKKLIAVKNGFEFNKELNSYGFYETEGDPTSFQQVIWERCPVTNHIGWISKGRYDT
jgi:hypothetical protein